MTLLLDVVSLILILTGTLFFTIGTIGLIRLPGTRNKLHALTKADNVGLGLILAGVALLLGSWLAAILLLIVWLIALGAASASAHILAQEAATEQDLSQPATSELAESQRAQEEDSSA